MSTYRVLSFTNILQKPALAASTFSVQKPPFYEIHLHDYLQSDNNSGNETVRRVRVGNTTPGTWLTWATAYSNLQTAITAYASGVEVWVAVPAGTAKYQTASSVPFTRKNGVKIYGGFNGSENLLCDRDFRLNVIAIYGNNHSFIANDNPVTNSVLIDGFTITGKIPHLGGMDNETASPTVQNAIFSNNVASYGGGSFYVWVGSPGLTNVVSTGNIAIGAGSDGNGGAIELSRRNKKSVVK